ncbi:MAG: YncE family protein [bacterium]
MVDCKSIGWPNKGPYFLVCFRALSKLFLIHRLVTLKPLAVETKVVKSIEHYRKRRTLAMRILTILLLILLVFNVVPFFSQTIVGILTKPDLRPTAIGIYETANKVYVADKVTANLYIFDGITNQELGFVPTGLTENINEIVIDEAYGKLYTCTYWSGNTQITVIDAVNDTLLRHIELPSPGTFARLGYDEGLHKVYAVFVGGLFQIDVDTDTVTSLSGITSNPNSSNLAVNPITHELFKCGYGYEAD